MESSSLLRRWTGRAIPPANQLIFTVNVAWERNNGIDVKWGISKLNAKNV